MWCQIAFDFFLRPSLLLPEYPGCDRGAASKQPQGRPSAGWVVVGGAFGRAMCCPSDTTWPYTRGAALVLQVNIIPIIAKADTIAKNELHKFKSKIMSELVSNGVQIYQFPTDEETVAEINATMSVCFPLSFVCLGFCGPIPEGRAHCAMFPLALKLQSEH